MRFTYIYKIGAVDVVRQTKELDLSGTERHRKECEDEDNFHNYVFGW